MTTTTTPAQARGTLSINYHRYATLSPAERAMVVKALRLAAETTQHAAEYMPDDTAPDLAASFGANISAWLRLADEIEARAIIAVADPDSWSDCDD